MYWRGVTKPGMGEVAFLSIMLTRVTTAAEPPVCSSCNIQNEKDQVPEFPLDCRRSDYFKPRITDVQVGSNLNGGRRMRNSKQALLLGSVMGAFVLVAQTAAAQDAGFRLGLGKPIGSDQTGTSPPRFFARADGGSGGGEASSASPGGTVSFQAGGSSTIASPPGQSVTNPGRGRK
jgi:hypothetical protein